MLAAPLEQSAVPVALLATRLITQTLYGGLNVFGIGSGGPNRQPTLVQFRLLPVSVEVRLPRLSVIALHPVSAVRELPMSGTAYGSGTLLLPPPVKRPPQARFLVTAPELICTMPQLPLPMPVVNESRMKLEVAQVHGWGMVVVVVVPVIVVVVVEHGDDCGSQRSVIVLRDCPAFARILHLPSCVPCFF